MGALRVLQQGRQTEGEGAHAYGGRSPCSLRAASWNGEREQRRPAGAQGVWTLWLLAELLAMGTAGGHRAEGGAGRGRAEAPRHGRRRACCSSSDQRRCRALAGAEVALGKKAPCPSRSPGETGRVSRHGWPCSLRSACCAWGKKPGREEMAARENRGVGMENFQVSTPIYRSSPRVRVS
ncbi:hypothetical protein Zm00014a_008744 [Zea mays]|uniref:Uncharacterized protein n=1 Tax=Zea mays TaxID=4577 RepID=A0A3L6EGH6_MAIZE|nr:hypothetical protein Zm00014a_008744 [Zea mays]